MKNHQKEEKIIKCPRSPLMEENFQRAKEVNPQTYSQGHARDILRKKRRR